FSLIKSPQISLLATRGSIVAAGCFACHFVIPDLIRQKLSPLSANGFRSSLVGRYWTLFQSNFLADDEFNIFTQT
uniref:Uncharacterized protein n=1 Tax=Cucumis melo TaxID=3656 RepID=A0A9I9CKI7_CUCME